MSEYTEMQVLRGPNMIVDIGPPSFTLVCGTQKWLTEWHPWFGPHVVTKSGDVSKRQPDERSRFWDVAQWWHDQGGKVVDGIGVWEEPPKRIEYMQHIGGRTYVQADGPGPGVVERLVYVDEKYNR